MPFPGTYWDAGHERVKGPEFRSKSKDTWPKLNVDLADIHEDDVEIKKSIQSNSVNVNNAEGMMSLMFSHVSNWNHLKKAVSWILRYKQWLLRKVRKYCVPFDFGEKKHITNAEMNEAEDAIIVCATGMFC